MLLKIYTNRGEIYNCKKNLHSIHHLGLKKRAAYAYNERKLLLKHKQKHCTKNLNNPCHRSYLIDGQSIAADDHYRTYADLQRRRTFYTS